MKTLSKNVLAISTLIILLITSSSGLIAREGRFQGNTAMTSITNTLTEIIIMGAI